MKVLVFSRIFPSVREPSRGIYNFHRFNALSHHCDVRVIAPRPIWQRTAQSTTDRDDFGRYQGLPVRYSTYWALPRIAPQWHASAMYRSLRREIIDLRREFHFDVILAAFAYPDVVAAAQLATETGCPFVGLVMGSDMNELAARPRLRPLIQRAFTQAQFIIALSSSLKDRIVELGIADSRVVVQQNGVDGVRFTIQDAQNARRQLGLASDRRIVCFIGNLVTEKGPDVLVEAIAQMDPVSQSDVDIVFVGDGRLRSDLESRARQLGLTGKIRFVGRRPPDEIPLWMAAGDLLCLPSRREGCPNVVLEALASGRPVVASNVGGVPDLLTQHNGIVVSPDDPARLAAALGEALQRKWEPSSLRNSVSSLTWDDLGKKFLEVLNSAVK